jgi:hypothetical protein
MEKRVKAALWLLSILVALSAVQLLVSLKVIGTTKWEYRVESVSDLRFEAEANLFGSEGWQVVSARRATQGEGGPPVYEFVLMRPAR